MLEKNTNRKGRGENKTLVCIRACSLTIGRWMTNVVQDFRVVRPREARPKS